MILKWWKIDILFFCYCLFIFFLFVVPFFLLLLFSLKAVVVVVVVVARAHPLPSIILRDHSIRSLLFQTGATLSRSSAPSIYVQKKKNEKKTHQMLINQLLCVCGKLRATEKRARKED